MRPLAASVLWLKFMEFWRFLPPVVGLGAALGRPAVAAAEPAPIPATAATSDAGVNALRGLLQPLRGELRAPASPRFASLRDPDRRGTRLLMGWVLPGLAATDRTTVAEVAALLASNGAGRLQKRLAALEPAVRVEASADELDGAPLLVVSIESTRTAPTKDLELAALEVIAALGAGEASDVRSLAQRYFTARSRAVVEVRPRDEPFRSQRKGALRGESEGAKSPRTKPAPRATSLNKPRRGSAK